MNEQKSLQGNKKPDITTNTGQNTDLLRKNHSPSPETKGDKKATDHTKTGLSAEQMSRMQLAVENRWNKTSKDIKDLYQQRLNLYQEGIEDRLSEMSPPQKEAYIQDIEHNRALSRPLENQQPSSDPNKDVDPSLQ